MASSKGSQQFDGLLWTSHKPQRHNNRSKSSNAAKCKETHHVSELAFKGFSITKNRAKLETSIAGDHHCQRQIIIHTLSGLEETNNKLAAAAFGLEGFSAAPASAAAWRSGHCCYSCGSIAPRRHHWTTPPSGHRRGFMSLC